MSYDDGSDPVIEPLERYGTEIHESSIDLALEAIIYRIEHGDIDARDGAVLQRQYWVKDRAKLVKAGEELATHSHVDFDPGTFDYPLA